MSTLPAANLLLSKILLGAAAPSTSMRFGIELEFEASLSATQAPTEGTALGAYWLFKPDGSLRNGLELVSVPLREDQVQQALEEAYRWAQGAGYRGTARTGMHIHANMAGRTPAQLAQIVACYCIAEPALFALAGEHREQNIYCVPWFTDQEMATNVAMLIRKLASSPRGVVSRADCWSRVCKYSALNLLCLSRMMTIEFRHLETPASAEAALTWFKVIRDLVVAAPQVAGGDSPLEVVREILLKTIDAGTVHAALNRAYSEGCVAAADMILSDSLYVPDTSPKWGVPAGLMPDVTFVRQGDIEDVRNLGDSPVEQLRATTTEEILDHLRVGRDSARRPRRRAVPAPPANRPAPAAELFSWEEIAPHIEVRGDGS